MALHGMAMLCNALGTYVCRRRALARSPPMLMVMLAEFAASPLGSRLAGRGGPRDWQVLGPLAAAPRLNPHQVRVTIFSHSGIVLNSYSNISLANSRPQPGPQAQPHR